MQNRSIIRIDISRLREKATHAMKSENKPKHLKSKQQDVVNEKEDIVVRCNFGKTCERTYSDFSNMQPSQWNCVFIEFLKSCRCLQTSQTTNEKIFSGWPTNHQKKVGDQVEVGGQVEHQKFFRLVDHPPEKKLVTRSRLEVEVEGWGWKSRLKVV